MSGLRNKNVAVGRMLGVSLLRRDRLYEEETKKGAAIL